MKATQATLVHLQWSPIMGKQRKRQRTEMRAVSPNNESRNRNNTEPLFTEQLNIETLNTTGASPSTISATVSSTGSCTSTESARDSTFDDVRSDVMYIPPLTKADELLTRFNCDDIIFNGTQYVEMHDDEDDDVIIDVEGDSTDDLSNDIRKPDKVFGDEHARDMNDDDVFKIELIESVDEIVIDDDDDVIGTR